MLEVTNLSRHYGGLKAVDDVTAHVDKGELVGLIGPNGAGKTTFFNLISGFTQPTTGKVKFKGKDVTGSKPYRMARMGMGRTFQNLRIFPNMTVFDNVSVGAAGTVGIGFGSAILGGKKQHDLISEHSWQALELAGLQDVGAELAANLSYGQRKYLEIARAISMQPELLILDEPAAGLNATETAKLAKFIQRLRNDGLTVILVEHDMKLVMSICDRVIVLASGAKIADGTPDEVQTAPAVLSAYLGDTQWDS